MSLFSKISTNQKKLLVISTSVLLLVFIPPSLFAKDIAIEQLEQMSQSFSSVAEKVSDSVVFIKVEKKIRRGYYGGRGQQYFNDPFDLFNDEFLRRFFGPPRQGRRRDQGQRKPKDEYHEMGQGSGFIISKDGYILTNNHVIGDADRVIVKLNNGKEYKAKIIGTDAQTDVAVIKIENGMDFSYLQLGSSSNVKVGDWVLAVGNPFGLSHTITAGIVSAKGRSNVGITEYEDFIQTDAAINPGNSGGPLINLKGEVVGINTAIYSRSGGYMGIGFAIPIDMAKKVRDQLVDKGSVERGYIGLSIQDLTDELAKSFGLEKPDGILIAEVTNDSPADKAGLKGGDVVLRVAGKKIENTGSFRNEIALRKPGSFVKLEILRDGTANTIEVKIASQADSGFYKNQIVKVGFKVDNLSEEYERKFGYQGFSGVIVTEVDPYSQASRIGIKPGLLIQSVNRRPVQNIGDFEEALTLSKESVLLLVRYGRGSRYVLLPLEVNELTK